MQSFSTQTDLAAPVWAGVTAGLGGTSARKISFQKITAAGVAAAGTKEKQDKARQRCA